MYSHEVAMYYGSYNAVKRAVFIQGNMLWWNSSFICMCVCLMVSVLAMQCVSVFFFFVHEIQVALLLFLVVFVYKSFNRCIYSFRSSFWVWNFPSSFGKMQHSLTHTLKRKHKPYARVEVAQVFWQTSIPLMRSRLSRLIQNVIKIMWILNTRVAFDLAELQTIWNIDGANTERYCDYVQSVALESANHSSDHCLWWCFWCFCWKNISNRKKNGNIHTYLQT